MHNYQTLEWISVKTQLPVRGKKVQVRINKDIESVATLIHFDWVSEEGYVFDCAGDPSWNLEQKVTHWKPISKR